MGTLKVQCATFLQVCKQRDRARNARADMTFKAMCLHSLEQNKLVF